MRSASPASAAHTSNQAAAQNDTAKLPFMISVRRRAGRVNGGAKSCRQGMFMRAFTDRRLPGVIAHHAGRSLFVYQHTQRRTPGYHLEVQRRPYSGDGQEVKRTPAR
jgi:hypothetical protein